MKQGTRLSILFAVAMLVAFGAFGEGYRTEVGSGPDIISLIVVKGTPYEMGYAFGELMKDEVSLGMGGYLDYAQSSGAEIYTDEYLDKAWAMTSPNVDERFKEELRGLADGSGVSLERLIRGHMVPVVSDYACSGVAVWDGATKDGHLYQIRNLDFTMDAHLQDYPAIVVYLPNEDVGIPHMNITFAGCIGCNTGINAEGIALSEKGASPKDDQPHDLDGEHFMTYFRQILYDAHSLDEAVTIVKNAKRIKKYRFYIGDGQDKKAVKIKAYAPDMLVWADNDPVDEVAPNVIENAIYYTMNDEAAFAHLTENWGNYDENSMIELSRLLATKNGNLLDVVYDATDLECWVAFAEGMSPASSRRYVPVNFKDYLTYDPVAAAAEAVVAAPAASGAAGGSGKKLALLGIPIVIVVAVLAWALFLR